MHLRISFLILIFVSATDEEAMTVDKIRVQFWDNVGRSEHDSTLVHEKLSTVQFTCLCTNCTSVQLYVVTKNKSYDMQLISSDEWTYSIEINSFVSLGEYKCRSNNSYFASYNWTYRVVYPCVCESCSLIYVNSVESCGSVKKEHCDLTHSFRPWKSVLCFPNMIQRDSFCDAYRAFLANILPDFELFSNNKSCEINKLVSIGDFKTAPYSIWMVKSDYLYLNCNVIQLERRVQYGSTVVLSAAGDDLRLCLIWPEKTNISVWINEQLREDSGQYEHGVAYQYSFKDNTAYRIKMVFEAAIDSSTFVRTYAYFVSIGGKAEILKESEQCVNGTKVSTLLRCRVSTPIQPMKEFRIDYKWRRSESEDVVGSLGVLNLSTYGIHTCLVTIIYDCGAADDYYLKGKKKPLATVSHNITLYCMVLGGATLADQGGLTNEVEDGSALYIHIIVALVILFVFIAIIVVASFAYIRWRKKRDLKYLIGETASTVDETVYSKQDKKDKEPRKKM